MSKVPAIVIERSVEQGVGGVLRQIDRPAPAAGEVQIAVQYSAVNYKDALAITGVGQIARRFPLVAGIDLAGTVAASRSKSFAEGDAVLVTGCGLSETLNGGYTSHQCVDQAHVVALPPSLTSREAMAIGTAGFAAALGLLRMSQLGQTPAMGPIVVTGASGGVGMLAIDILSQAGFEVHAITRKLETFDRLKALGAKQCILNQDLYWGQRPLESTKWAGAIDNLGGDMLAGLSRVIQPWGNIACIGLASDSALQTTVMPLVLRGVSLLGVNSAGAPRDIRERVWQRLASDWKPNHLDDIVAAEVSLDDVLTVGRSLIDGQHSGRTLVKLAG